MTKFFKLYYSLYSNSARADTGKFVWCVKGSAEYIIFLSSYTPVSPRCLKSAEGHAETCHPNLDQVYPEGDIRLSTDFNPAFIPSTYTYKADFQTYRLNMLVLCVDVALFRGSGAKSNLISQIFIYTL